MATECVLWRHSCGDNPALLGPTMPGVEDLADQLALDLADELDRRLADEDAALVERFPGERPGRQPVHTVYVPADRYGADLTRAWGDQAAQAMTDREEILRETLGEA